MALFVGILLIAIAGLTIGIVFYFVLQEKHEHYEHFIPPPKVTATDVPVENIVSDEPSS
jgi:hypothetical protein